ncbi:MAG: hypothetical protein HKN49_02815 [Gammaproteobacteria bacterium]|nr:hypothetical protein [Gammaproteobacteria bacterium]
MLSFRNNFLLILGLLLAMPVAAVEYTLLPSVMQRAYYDSNIVLAPVDLEEVFSYEVAPSLLLRARDPGYSLDVRGTLRTSQVSNSNYESDDQLFALDFERMGERSRLEVSLDADRVSTLSQAEQLGVSLQALRAENYSARANYTQLLSERNSVGVGANWGRSNYDSRSRFSDYDSIGYDLSYLRQLTESSTLSVVAYQSDYEFGGVDSETRGLQVAYDRSVNQRLSTFGLIGARDVETRYPQFCDFFSAIFGLCDFGEEIGAFVSDSSGFTGRVGFDYQGEVYQLGASYERTLQPNSLIGGLLESDRINLNGSRQIGPRLHVDLVAEFFNEDAVDEISFDRSRSRINVGLRWRMAERWTLRTMLRHRMRKDERLLGGVPVEFDPDSTALIMQLNYSHPRMQWSR